MVRDLSLPKSAAGAILLILAGLASGAHAQFVPYYYGGWGGWGNQSYSSAVSAQEQNRAIAQQMTASRNARISQSVNSSLMSQAQSRTQNIANQRQEARDWWFQTQQQQAVSRKAQLAAQPSLAALAAYAPPPSAAEATPGPTKTTQDVIAWPELLKDPVFAQERARVERPFISGQKTITIDDYRGIAEAAGQMKKIVDSMADDVVATEYLMVTKFLDQLANEARDRIKRLSK